MRLYQLRSMDWMWLISRAIAKWSNCNHPLYVPSIWRCLWPTRTTVCSPQWSMTKPQQTTVDWWRISAYRWEPDSFNWWLCSGTWGQHHAIEQRIRAPVDLDNRSSILFLFLSPRLSSCSSCCNCRCFSSTSLRFRSSLNLCVFVHHSMPSVTSIASCWSLVVCYSARMGRIRSTNRHPGSTIVCACPSGYLKHLAQIARRWYLHFAP